MIWLLLAAQVSAPTPLHADSWFGPNDVPVVNINSKGLIWVGYGITVDPDGQADNCRVEYSSGDQTTDRFVCATVLKHARFLPARNADGTATYGVYRDSISWWSGDNPDPNALPDADVELTVDRMPDHAHAPADVRVAFTVDPSGKASSCSYESVAKGIDQGLAAAACTHLLAGFNPLPARTTNGQTVASVQDATVRFLESRR